jgi:hypothetical protein
MKLLPRTQRVNDIIQGRSGAPGTTRSMWSSMAHRPPHLRGPTGHRQKGCWFPPHAGREPERRRPDGGYFGRPRVGPFQAGFEETTLAFAINSRRPRSSSFAPTASHRCRIASASTMLLIYAASSPTGIHNPESLRCRTVHRDSVNVRAVPRPCLTGPTAELLHSRSFIFRCADAAGVVAMWISEHLSLRAMWPAGAGVR